MKNPIAYFKHLAKDPVNTIAEADARKKELMPFIYGSAGVLALGLILQVAAKLDFMAVFSFIGLAGLAVFGFLLSVVISIKRKFEALTCDGCNTMAEIKTHEDFAKYVSYTVEKNEAVFKGYTGNKEPTNGVYSLVKFTGSSSAVLSVQLTCPHCGKVRKLRYTAEPFNCYAEATKVGALAYPAVRTSLETAVRTAVNDYNDPNKRESIPYTYQSTKNPNYEEKPRGRILGGTEVNIDYMGAKIHFHQDVEEMLEHYFVIPMLNGTLSDPSKSKKK